MHPLATFAKLYASRLLDSEVKSIDGPESAAVSLFYKGVDWYCEKWPGADFVVFFSDTEDAGMCATHCVDLRDDSVVAYP